MHQRGVVWKYRDEMDQNLPQVLEPYNLDHLTVSLLKCKKEKLSRDIYAAHSDDFFYKNKEVKLKSVKRICPVYLH